MHCSRQLMGEPRSVTQRTRFKGGNVATTTNPGSPPLRPVLRIDSVGSRFPLKRGSLDYRATRNETDLPASNVLSDFVTVVLSQCHEV
jgi:hypothetical protein